jgi:hypothetical protein
VAGRRVLVDDELRTLRPVGDCAQHAGRVQGPAAPAPEQAVAPARVRDGAEPLPSDGGPLPHLLTNDGGS